MTPWVVRACPGFVPEPLPGSRDVRPAAFLDRDGVMNIDKEYVSRIEDFEWVDGARDAVTWLQSRGLRVFIVTNQSGIGRGYYTEEEFERLTAWFLSQTPVDALFYCPHTPEAACPARKPGAGMLVAADALFGVDKAASFLVGDKATDMEAATAFGIEGYMFSGGNLLTFVQSLL